MKKIFGMLSLFLGLGLIVCIICGFVFPIPEIVAESSRVAYKICNGMSYFFKFLPALIFTGFVVTLSVYFGHNSEGSQHRFSDAMFSRLKLVMISSLICVLILTLVSEAFTLLINRKKSELENRPGLIKEYISVANSLYDQGYAKRAQRYGQAALVLDPKSKEALEISQKAEIKAKSDEIKTPVFDTSLNPVVEKDHSLKIDEQKIRETTTFLELARISFENEKWFDAHYYAEKGLMLVTAKDPNVDELKNLSVQAWNNITDIHDKKKTTDQLAFEEKYRGYLALVEKDDLKAYYIFKGLSEKSIEYARDSDILFYLDVAQKKVQEKTFFIDETLELENFEQENNVYFIHTYPDGAKALWFFKGMSSVDTTGYSVQYLRDFYIVSLDSNGKWEKTMHVPYAKVMPVPIASIDESTRKLYGITNDMKSIPYMLLKSVGRSDSSQCYIPEFKYPDGTVENSPEYMIFPIDYDDFIKLEKSSGAPETMSLATITSLAFKSKEYGFAEEMYGQVVMNRFLYPLFILVLMIVLASFAWNNRIGETQYFKFSWLLSIPIIICVFMIVYYLMLFIFHLINYTFLAAIGGIGALFAALGFYVVLLIVAMIHFLARRTKS